MAQGPVRQACRACVILLVLAVSAGEVSAQAKVAAQPRVAERSDAVAAYFELVTQSSADRTRPRTKAEWERLATDAGLRPEDRESGMWALTSAAGRVRASASFMPEQTSLSVTFFPTSSESVSDAVLSYLLKDPRHTSLDADSIEIGIAPVEELPGDGRKTQSITVKLGGGRLLASKTTIDWPVSR